MFVAILQSVAELEQKWQNEVEEAQQGKLENNAPFFHDYHFFEVHIPLPLILHRFSSNCSLFSSHNLFLFPQNKMKELELLCSLKEVPLDCSDLENVVLTLR